MRSSSWKWWVCGLLLLATTLNYMDRLTLNQLSGRIMGEFQLDTRDYGYLESAFAYAFAIGAIIFGWMADRWNVRWIYPIAVLVWSAAGFATGLTSGFTDLVLCRFCLGLAESGNWPCALRTTQHILPSGQRGLGNGILQSGAAIGAVVTPIIIFVLVLKPEMVSADLPPVYHPGAWRWPFVAIGVLGIIWVVLWLISVRRADLALERRASPSLMGIVAWLVVLIGFDLGLKVLQDYRPELKTFWLTLPVTAGVCGLGISAVLLWLFRATAVENSDEPLTRSDFVRRFWVLVVLVVSINGLWHFFRAWMPLFLQKQHDFSETHVSASPRFYYATTAVGSLTAGFASLFLVRRGLTIHRSRLWIFGICARC